MLLPHGIVVALANGARYELYRNAGTETEPRLEEVSVPALEARNKSAGVHHQVSPANPSGNLLEEDAHAAAVADWLNHEALTHKFEKLVIVAAPRTLGELRRHYHKELEAVIVAELDKDLVGAQPNAIIAALRARD